MRVRWFEQTEKDLPIENDWLSGNEITRLAGMRFPKRRSDWRLGRWTAKRALAFYLGMPSGPDVLRKIEIRPEPSGAPVTFILGDRFPVSISLSHSSGTALCAIAPEGVALGCDLEVVEERHPAFAADYFTDEEQQCVVSSPLSDRYRKLTLLWSAKESALKALRTGLRLDTRSVRVHLPETEFDPSSWSTFEVSSPGGQIFHGWHATADNLVRTIVADVIFALPVAPDSYSLRPLTTSGIASQPIDVARLSEHHASHHQ